MTVVAAGVGTSNCHPTPCGDCSVEAASSCSGVCEVSGRRWGEEDGGMIFGRVARVMVVVDMVDLVVGEVVFVVVGCGAAVEEFGFVAEQTFRCSFVGSITNPCPKAENLYSITNESRILRPAYKLRKE